MPTVQLTLPRLHPGQRRVLEHRARFAVLACGRRWGKTTLEVDLAVHTALAGYPVAWFAPHYKLLEEAWRELKHRLGPVAKTVSETQHRLELLTGGVIDCWTLVDEDPARGRKYKRAIIDEASVVRDLMTRWQKAIRPTLTDLEGDAVFGGTPKGMNAFWQLAQRGLRGDPGWSFHTAPSTDNPHLPPGEVEAARGDMTDAAFRQEYEAAFVEDGASIFRRVGAAARLGPQERDPAHWYVMGVDWARHDDYTVLSVVDATAREQVFVDRFSDVNYALQTGRLRETIKRYQVAVVLAELNAMGEPLVEDLQAEGLPVRGWTASNQTKAVVVDALSLAIENGRVALLDDEAQTGELLAYTSERLPSGLMRYTAPEGMHDDTVIALALAWQAAETTGPRPDPTPYGIGAGGTERRPLTPRERLALIRGKGVDPFARRDDA